MLRQVAGGGHFEEYRCRSYWPFKGSRTFPKRKGSCWDQDHVAGWQVHLWTQLYLIPKPEGHCLFLKGSWCQMAAPRARGRTLQTRERCQWSQGLHWLRGGEAVRPQSHWPVQRQMSLAQVSFLHYLVVASQVPALNALASESYFDFAIFM